MNQPRIALVTSRFWPISGVPQILAGELAVGLKESGCHVEVITSRWEHSWNQSFTFQGIPVHRLPVSSSGPWGSFRTQRALTKRLNDRWDAAIIFGIDDHFEPTVRVLSKTTSKILLRLDDSIAPGQLLAESLSRRVLAALENVDQVICSDSNLMQRVVAMGVERGKVHVVPDGVPNLSDQLPTDKEQSQYRLALSDAHPVLAIEPNEPLVVTGMPLNGDAGIHDLVHAWKLIARRHPRSRLWILGDGVHGRKIWEQITQADLVYSVIMPGYFDCIDDLFLAADIYVNPARDVTGHACLTRAMACGVCPISTDDVNGLVEDDVNGVIVARQDSRQLSSAILSLVDEPHRRERLGEAAKESACRELPFQKMIAQYVELIQQTSDSSCESAP